MSDSRDRPIQVGDLVQVVRPKPCCGNADILGSIFQVVSFDTANRCSTCDHSYQSQPTAHAEGDANCGTLLIRLRRIPPLEELEGQRTEETLRTPLRVPAVTHSGEEGR